MLYIKVMAALSLHLLLWWILFYNVAPDAMWHVVGYGYNSPQDTHEEPLHTSGRQQSSAVAGPSH